jgi:hypothetical protein
MSFVSYKHGEQEGRKGHVWGIGTGGKGEDIRKGYGRVNLLEISCIHLCTWKNETH